MNIGKNNNIIISIGMVVLFIGCGSSNSTSSNEASTVLKVTDGPIKSAQVSIIDENNNEIYIGETNTSGEIVIKNSILNNLEGNITLKAVGGIDENGVINGVMFSPVLSVGELKTFIENKATLNITPTTTAYYMLQKDTNSSLMTNFLSQLPDENNDGKKDINDVILHEYNASKLGSLDNNLHTDFTQYILSTPYPDINNAVNKIINALNQAPIISISADETNITVGDSVTLTANASDQDGTIDSIIWYDSNENQIGTGNSITITPNSTGTFSYYAVATDNDGATKQSNTITINVEEVTYNASWQTPLQSEVNNVGVEPGVISDASGSQVVINDLTSYTSNLPTGSTFKIVSISPSSDRAKGFRIEGNSLVWDGPNTGASRETVTITIQIVYPDGSLGPTNSGTFTIANT